MRPLKQIHIRMIPPEGHQEDAYTFRAPAGRHYTEESEQTAVEKVVEYLDKKYPWWEFKMVRVGRGKYNFIYDGLREQRAALGENDNDESLHRSIED